MPMTAKMKMMIQRTKVRFPRAPMVFPIMEMRRLSVGQDLANLNTLSWGRMVVIKLVVVVKLVVVLGVKLVVVIKLVVVKLVLAIVTRMTLSWSSLGLGAT